MVEKIKLRGESANTAAMTKAGATVPRRAVVRQHSGDEFEWSYGADTTGIDSVSMLPQLARAAASMQGALMVLEGMSMLLRKVIALRLVVTDGALPTPHLLEAAGLKREAN